jgi:hypothetical protein
VDALWPNINYGNMIGGGNAVYTGLSVAQERHDPRLVVSQ